MTRDRLSIRSTSYPVEARSKGGGVSGIFGSGSDTFSPEARFQGDALVLTSGVPGQS